MKNSNIFSKEDLSLAKQLAYENWENQEVSDIGFEFKGAWVTNPFVEVSGRFEFENLDAMCEYYGRKNVLDLLNKLLEDRFKKEEDCMQKWVFQSKFVNEDTYKHNGEEVKLISTNGTMATIEFMDGTQAEVFVLEVQEKR